MKKLCLALALLLAVLFLTGAAVAEEESNSVDVIMVLDYSGSMKDNDPNKLMVKSVMNFIDMCDVSGSRVALIPFNISNHDTDSEWQRAFNRFRDLTNISSREAIRHDLLTNPSFHYAYDTDGGYGFRVAWDLYTGRAGDPAANDEAIVLFFSDGVIKIGGTRETEASQAAADQYVQEFKNAGVPIYVIGLRGEGDFNADWLNFIARETGTEYARIVDNDSSSLHEFFSQIFAAYLGTEPLPIEQRDIAVGDDGTAVISINIPNNSIVEANIRLSLDNPRATFGDVIGLTRPNGAPVTPTMNGTPTDGQVIVGNSGAYYNLKLIRPEQGEWKLTLDTESAQMVSVEIIANYDIGVRFRPIDASALHKGDPLRLEAEFYSTTTGEVYATDEFLYRMEMIAGSVATLDGAPIENFFRVEEGPNGTYLFVGELPRLERGSYAFQIKVDGAGIMCESDVITFDLDNQPPVRIGDDPEPIGLSVDSMLWRKASPTMDINLRQYFRDPDNDDLTFTVSGRNEAVSAPVNESSDTLKIQCNAAGEATLVIKAFDGQEYSDRTLTLNISVKSCKAQATTELLILCGVLLLILILLIIIARKNRGRFIASAAFEATYANLTFSMTPNSMIYLSRYSDKTVNLYTVLDDASAGMDSCHQIDAAEKNILSGFILKPKRKGEVILTNKSAGGMTITVSGGMLGRNKSVKLHTGSNVQIDFSEPGRSIMLMYRYE